MGQRTHQLATADRMGQVVLLVVLAVEQHQAAAVVERVQLGLVERGGLLQAIAVALQQLGQARPRQAAQLVLGAELDGQHGTTGRTRNARLRRAAGWRRAIEWRFVVGDLQFVVVEVGRQSCRALRLVIVQIDVEAFGARLRALRDGAIVILLEIIVIERIAEVEFRLGLFRHQPCLQLARKVTDLVLAPGTRRRIVRIAQPEAHLHQRCRQLAAEAQAQHQRQGQQDQAEQAHALQADGHRLLELLHVEADAQVAGDYLLEADRGRIKAAVIAEQAFLRARAGLGQHAVVDAVDRRVGDQRILHQIAQQHVQAKDVVGHQQIGGRGGSLRDQALAEGIGLLRHGVLELHADHPGVDDQRQRHEQQRMGGDAQHQRHAVLAHGAIEHEEEVVWLYGCGPVHRARLFSSGNCRAVYG